MKRTQKGRPATTRKASAVTATPETSWTPARYEYAEQDLKEARGALRDAVAEVKRLARGVDGGVHRDEALRRWERIARGDVTIEAVVDRWGIKLVETVSDYRWDELDECDRDQVRACLHGLIANLKAHNLV